MSGHDRFALAEWRRIRRYAVPETMIAECAEARERGDWRAAFAAARVDVAFEPSLAARAEELAVHVAPDLLRWHLPRALGGYTTLATDRRFVLAPDGPVTPGTVVLTVDTPTSVLGSQRLTIGAMLAGERSEPGEEWIYPLPAYLWDARRAGGLRTAVGGSAVRLPGFTPEGRPLPGGGSGDDLPAVAERVRAAPSATEAFAAAGLTIEDDETDVRPWEAENRSQMLATVDPLRLRHDLSLLAGQFQQASWDLVLGYWSTLRAEVSGGEMRLRWVSGRSDPEPGRIFAVGQGQLSYAPDLELVRSGRLTAGDLHPLVRSALFPAAADPDPRPAAEAGPVRVRCRGDWHEVEHRAGRLHLHAHDAAEQQRERALRAFGGEITGCFAAQQAWTGSSGRLPKRLRDEREDLWQRMTHGGTRVVFELLDAGAGPELTDGRGRTLLHRIRSFDHARLLPRLLAEGLDVNTPDQRGFTALYLAVTECWPPELIRALVDAGADPHRRTRDGESAVTYIDTFMEWSEDHPNHAFVEVLEYVKARA